MKTLLLTDKEINMLRIAVDSYIECEKEELLFNIKEVNKPFVKENKARIKLLKNILKKAV